MDLKPVVVTTAGGAGTSVGTGDTEVAIRGYLEAIAVNYGSAPATTTVTITENDGFLSRPILAIPAGNTNAVIYPRAKLVDATNTAITNSFGLFYVQYTLHVAIGAANNGNVITVHFYMNNTFWE